MIFTYIKVIVLCSIVVILVQFYILIFYMLLYNRIVNFMFFFIYLTNKPFNSIQFNSSQIFTGLLLDAYVEVHQVRRLVFDNITNSVQCL